MDDFIAILKYKSSEDGGRTTPVVSGYRPAIKFPFDKMLTSGQQTFLNKERVFPGDTVEASIKIIAVPYFEGRLSEGMEFVFTEGPRIIGTGVIKEIINQKLKIESMTKPPYLKPGEKVGIVSTAKRCEPSEIEYGLATLKSWGLEPVVGKNAFNECGFLAGTDDERLADLQQMLDDESIKAIFFTKGGYGTLRIIDRIDWTKFRQHPKWLVGYSDITLLHCHVHNFGIETLHAVMLQGYPKATHEALESIRKVLFGESLSYMIPAEPENRAGEAVEGVLVGGNLSILYATIGSDSEIDTAGKVLFIEDIDEYLYHYDRMLISLRRAGKFNNLKAVIVGGMVDIKNSTIPFGKNDREITLEYFDCPFYFNFPAGHIEDNRALVMGREISIEPTAHTIKFTQHGR